MSIVRSWLQPCRWGWVALAAFVLLVPLLEPAPGASQTGPGPRPDGSITFYDENGLFPNDERATLARDANLLQSTEIPTLVYVRVVTASEASASESLAFANAVRQDWDIESSADADDGLVLLFSWVPQDPASSTAVVSYGDHTFDDSGLTPGAIERTIATSVDDLIEQGQPFEALVYLMRETRYTGIYAPPAPAPRTGAAQALHDALRVLGPALVIAAAGILATLTSRFWKGRPGTREIVAITASGLAVITILWTLSVYAQSRPGILSALAMLLALGIATWTWSRLRFTRHGSAPVRRRAVPATVTRMRRRRQARTPLAIEPGGRR